MSDNPFAHPETESDNTVPHGGPVAGGKRTPIPENKPIPDWESTDVQDSFDSADDQVDYHDLTSLNRELQRLRIRMANIRRAMRNAGRESVEAKMRYQRALRRALVQQSGGSAESRKANAELQCEELEADMAMKAQVAEEYVTLFRSVRDDVENAKVVAYNLRALMQM